MVRVRVRAESFYTPRAVPSQCRVVYTCSDYYITKYRLISGVSSLTCRAHAWNRKFHFHQLGLNHFELLKADYFVVIVTVMSLTSTLHACMPQSSSSSLSRYDAEDYNGATWNGRYVSNTDMLYPNHLFVCLFVLNLWAIWTGRYVIPVHGMHAMHGL